MQHCKPFGILAISRRALGFLVRTGGLLVALAGVLGCMVCVGSALAQSKRKLPCLNGPCYPNAMTFGYHQTRWRRWPVTEAGREPGAPLRDVPLPPVDLPPPDNEDYLRPQNEWERRRPRVPPGWGLPPEAPLTPSERAPVTPPPDGTREGEGTGQPGETTEPRLPRRYQPGGGEQIFQPPGGFPIEPRTPGNNGDSTDLDRLFQGTTLPPGSSQSEVSRGVDVGLPSAENAENSAQQGEIPPWQVAHVGLRFEEGHAELELAAPGTGRLAATPPVTAAANEGTLNPAGTPLPLNGTSVQAPAGDMSVNALPAGRKTTPQRAAAPTSAPVTAFSTPPSERVARSSTRAWEAWQAVAGANPLRPGSSDPSTAGARPTTLPESQSSVTQTALWRERGERGPELLADFPRVIPKNPLR